MADREMHSYLSQIFLWTPFFSDVTSQLKHAKSKPKILSFLSTISLYIYFVVFVESN